MACPFFHPAAQDFVDAPGWHPLGDAHRGSCQANPREPFQPSDRTLHDLCNLGYAALTCPRFPANADADAVRFTIARDEGGVIGLYYVAEKNHLPQSHGPLEYSRAAGAFTLAHADAILQWQAEAYLASYLRRQPNAS
jgi:hypothetical protein